MALFSALWESDGTAAGTHRVLTPLNGLGTCSFGPDLPRVATGDLVVSFASEGTGCEPWRVADGAVAPIADLAPGAEGSSPQDFLRLGDLTLFAAVGPGLGAELWRTDGTAAGTLLLRDLFPGPQSSAPVFLGRLGEEAIFAASDPEGGREPWITNGAAGSLRRLADLAPGAESSDPRLAGTAGGNLFLWTSVDGRLELRVVGADGSVETLKGAVEANLRPGAAAGPISCSAPRASFPTPTRVSFSAARRTSSSNRAVFPSRRWSCGRPTAAPRGAENWPRSPVSIRSSDIR